MPIYEYTCKKCGHLFDYLAFKISEPDPPCPNCGSEEVKKLMSSGFVRADGIPSGSGGFAGPKCGSSGGG